MVDAVASVTVAPPPDICSVVALSVFPPHAHNESASAAAATTAAVFLNFLINPPIVFVPLFIVLL